VTTSSHVRSGSGAWGAISRQRWKILVVAVLMAVLGYVLPSQLLTPSYATTSTITLSKDRPYDPTTSNASSLGDPTKWATLQAAVAGSETVLSVAASTLPADLRSTFRDGLEILAVDESNQITVTASAEDPQDAATIADAVATAYQTVNTQKVQQATTAALTAVGDDTAQQQTINLNASAYGNGISVLDAATVPTAASPPYAWQIAALAGLVGLFAASGAVAWRAHLNQRVDTSPLEGIAELGRWNSVPRGRGIGDQNSVESRNAGIVLVGLQHLGHLRTPRLEVSSVLVTAASGDAGALATGLAASAARAGRRVVLVDADEGGSRLAAFGAPVAGAEQRILPERRWSEEIHPWVIGGGAVVGVLPLEARSLQPHVVGAGVRHLVEAGYLVIFVGGSVVNSPVAFAVAGEVDAVLVQIEAEPRAEVVSRTLAQLSIAAPAVVAQVVVGDTSNGTPASGERGEPLRQRPVAPPPSQTPEVSGHRG
jgi:capsular polysaccharide biosynthesis protein